MTQDGQPPGPLCSDQRDRGRTRRRTAANRSPPAPSSTPAPDADADGGHQQRRAGDARVGLVGQDEVGAEAQRRAEPPQHTDRVQPEAAEQVQDQHHAGHGDAGADEDRRGRRRLGPPPVPADEQDGGEIFQQQRHAHREVLHRVEVAELRARDGHDAVDDEASGLAQRREALRGAARAGTGRPARGRRRRPGRPPPRRGSSRSPAATWPADPDSPNAAAEARARGMPTRAAVAWRVVNVVTVMSSPPVMS